MQGVLRAKTVESSTGSITQNNLEENNVASLFAGKGLKVEVSRLNGTEAEDWVFKIKEFFKIYGVPEE